MQSALSSALAPVIAVALALGIAAVPGMGEARAPAKAAVLK
jgi:hypothetical protein